MTIGIPPSGPATGYGYIRPGAEIGDGAREVAAFVEKPDAARAAQYLLDGYLWNSGNFIFDAATMRAEFEAFEPEIVAPVADAVAQSKRDLDFLLLDAEAFARAKKRSGSVCLNGFRVAAKWFRPLVTPPPGLAAAHS